MTVEEILQSKDKKLIKALFQFKDEPEEMIIAKFNLWARYFFSKYFTADDASFHKEIDLSNLQAYQGKIESFVDIAFRGAAKTARTKLFIGFVIENDLNHFRKYIKVLSADGVNSKQITTDIYNILVTTKDFYSEVFEKTDLKREETMSSFTTSTGIKVIADTVGTDQRGAIQENARPDFIWFEDFENRMTLRSLVKTKTIWDNMEEARTSLAKGGAGIYTCNYISEMGNVHKLVVNKGSGKKVLIVPIIENGQPTWSSQYSKDDIEKMKENDDDFEGERLCKPSASKDVVFDRETLDNMKSREPLRIISGFKIFREFDPSHRYGSGHDVAGGMGLDSSTSVFIDFDTLPARVVGTFHSNTIKPETFGDEIKREGEYFGMPIAGIENNKFDATILKAKQNGVNIYQTKRQSNVAGGSFTVTDGWNTNSLTKSKMIFALVKAVNDGLIELADEDLIQECKSYTRNDLIDEVRDPRLTTRHFDLLIAGAIAWQMKDEAKITKKEVYQQIPYQPSEFEGGGLQNHDYIITQTPTGGKVNLNTEYQQAPIETYD